MSLTKVTYSMIDSAPVNVKDFGATGDGVTDDTTAIQAAVAYCLANEKNLYVPLGEYLTVSLQLNINKPISIFGDGQAVSKIIFGGDPTKSVVTQIKWNSVFDTGDISSSFDDPVAYAVWLNSRKASLVGVSILTDTNYKGYSTPFNYASDAPKTNYDYGILITSAQTFVENVTSEGVWNIAGLGITFPISGSLGDRFSTSESYFCGFWGVAILGPQGEFLSGDEYKDLDALDTRCSGGISDIGFVNCELASTHSNLSTRLEIDGVNKRIRRTDLPAGGLYINGQLSTNAAKRIQGHRFFNCRFKGSDLYTYSLNYANRVEFVGCHSDPSRDSVAQDGVSSIPSNLFRRKITENTLRIKFLGGNDSGENLSEVDFSNVSENSFDKGGVLTTSYYKSRESGTIIPSLNAVSGSIAAYGARQLYYEVRGGICKVWGRIQVTDKGDVSGALTVDMPFVSRNVSGLAYAGSVSLVSQCSESVQGITLGVSSKVASFTIENLSGGVTLLTGPNIANDFRIDFYLEYLI